MLRQPLYSIVDVDPSGRLPFLRGVGVLRTIYWCLETWKTCRRSWCIGCVWGLSGAIVFLKQLPPDLETSPERGWDSSLDDGRSSRIFSQEVWTPESAAIPTSGGRTLVRGAYPFQWIHRPTTRRFCGTQPKGRPEAGVKALGSAEVTTPSGRVKPSSQRSIWRRNRRDGIRLGLSLVREVSEDCSWWSSSIILLQRDVA